MTLDRFEDFDAALSAWMDGETSAAETRAVEARLATDDQARVRRDELQRVRRAAIGVFAEMRLESPPLPPALLSGRRLPVRRFGVVLAMAAVVIAAVMVFWPTQAAEAKPADLIERAAVRLANVESVLFWGRLEMPGVAALARALGNDEKDLPSEGLPVRILVDRDDRFIVQRADAPNADFDARYPLFGGDAHSFWSWDPAAGVVETSPDNVFGLKIETAADEASSPRASDGDERRFLDFIRWGFVEQLRLDSGKLDLEEVTWPADRRAGRRVFCLKIKEKAGERGFSFTRAKITIDPRQDLIERVHFESSFIGFALVSVSLEVAEIDPPHRSAFNEYATYVPEGTPVR